MPKPLLSPEEFQAEMRRRGLVLVPLAIRNLVVWRNENATVFRTLPNYIGFIPHGILADALEQAGIAYDPAGAPE